MYSLMETRTIPSPQEVFDPKPTSDMVASEVVDTSMEMAQPIGREERLKRRHTNGDPRKNHLPAYGEAGWQQTVQEQEAWKYGEKHLTGGYLYGKSEDPSETLQTLAEARVKLAEESVKARRGTLAYNKNKRQTNLDKAQQVYDEAKKAFLKEELTKAGRHKVGVKKALPAVISAFEDGALMATEANYSLSKSDSKWEKGKEWYGRLSKTKQMALGGLAVGTVGVGFGVVGGAAAAGAVFGARVGKGYFSKEAKRKQQTELSEEEAIASWKERKAIETAERRKQSRSGSDKPVKLTDTERGQARQQASQEVSHPDKKHAKAIVKSARRRQSLVNMQQTSTLRSYNQASHAELLKDLNSQKKPSKPELVKTLADKQLKRSQADNKVYKEATVEADKEKHAKRKALRRAVGGASIGVMAGGFGGDLIADKLSDNGFEWRGFLRGDTSIFLDQEHEVTTNNHLRGAAVYDGFENSYTPDTRGYMPSEINDLKQQIAETNANVSATDADVSEQITEVQPETVSERSQYLYGEFAGQQVDVTVPEGGTVWDQLEAQVTQKHPNISFDDKQTMVGNIMNELETKYPHQVWEKVQPGQSFHVKLPSNL